jgi:FixJ family two-component response regulator
LSNTYPLTLKKTLLRPLQLEWNNDPKSNNIRIWIAEDDAELREILGDSLAHGQREIRLFEDGQAVLEAVRSSSLDILVTDLIMPGVDGLQLLNEVKRVHPESIVIIMTGYGSLDSAIQAIRGGAYDYIRKPFKLEEMKIAITNVCEKIFLMRENKYLLHRLQETMEDLEHLKTKWDEHLTKLMNIYWVISKENMDSEMEIILKQMDPRPPDYEVKKGVPQGKTLDRLDRLIQFKREGLINDEEFSSFKKILFEKLKET